jgi:hypothetical protein
MLPRDSGDGEPGQKSKNSYGRIGNGGEPVSQNTENTTGFRNSNGEPGLDAANTNGCISG